MLHSYVSCFRIFRRRVKVADIRVNAPRVLVNDIVHAHIEGFLSSILHAEDDIIYHIYIYILIIRCASRMNISIQVYFLQCDTPRSVPTKNKMVCGYILFIYRAIGCHDTGVVDNSWSSLYEPLLLSSRHVHTQSTESHVQLESSNSSPRPHDPDE